MAGLSCRKQFLETLPKVAISSSDIAVLLTAKDYFKQLLSLIEASTVRIYLTVLYLENDEAGRLIMECLIAAKQRNPHLEIKIFVDFHRARRGQIGQKEAENNAAFYRKIDQEYPGFNERPRPKGRGIRAVRWGKLEKCKLPIFV